MRALITGASGFVGSYLRRELEANGYEVLGLDLTAGERVIQADLLKPEELAAAVEQVRPEVVFHLAGQADVARSWRQPQRTIELNVLGAINLMEAVRAFNPEVRMVVVGSSDQYGSLGGAGVSIREDMDAHPQTPYAVSKKAQEEMAKIYVRAYGMNICMTRSFNHCGAGQRRGFLIPDFAAGVVLVETGAADALRVGNLTSRRDFTHVRDVVHAYRLLAERGKAGEVYNVGSGVTWSAQEILDKLCALAGCPIPVEQDPAKMRPSDTPVICCDHGKLTRDTGWEPQIPIDVALREVLEEWRKR